MANERTGWRKIDRRQFLWGVGAGTAALSLVLAVCA